MIIARARGGLGNQMFQYATARALSLRLGAPFRLHVPREHRLHDRPFELRCFAGEIPIASLRDFLPFRGGPLAICLLARRRHPQVFIERGHNYDPCLRDVRLPVYLDGYWQCEDYFVAYREQLLADFAFASPPSGRNAELLAELAGSESVAVHVRRGDYLSNPGAFAEHGLAPLAYYKAALRAVGERVSRPRFYVFSDDPAWTRRYLSPLASVTIVDHNRSGVEDLRLMAACRHQIIANSSFSWWGAWLNRNPTKVVIAPRSWLNKPASEFEDVYPAGVVRI